jgi:16S rRNA (adenine1518-N6/adenine1519-N6)-dimethyltransferase
VSQQPRYGRAKKSLGQNFLVDGNLQRRIVTALGAGPDDEVLEIGPGRGALTGHLVGAVGRLVLVELDDDLASALVERWGSRDDVVVVHGDVLEVPLADHLRDPAATRVVGNIPYNITTPILFRLLQRPRPRDIVLMVQDEVADRIVAPAGDRNYGALSVGVRTVARAEKLFRVKRGAFRPVPGVDSAVVRITPLRPEPLTPAEEERLRRTVRAAFQWRRKQLRKILRDHPDLARPEAVVERVLVETGLAPETRPERLEPQDFVRLAAALG